MSDIYEGGCLCGAVRYRAQGPLRPIIACHCQQCRRASGHHTAATSTMRNKIEIKGAPVWYGSSSGHQRGFCGICGSQIFWDRTGLATLSIFAGSLDDPKELSLAGHIFCADKGAYYEITDDLPKAQASDPVLTTQG